MEKYQIDASQDLRAKPDPKFSGDFTDIQNLNKLIMNIIQSIEKIKIYMRNREKGDPKNLVREGKKYLKEVESLMDLKVKSSFGILFSIDVRNEILILENKMKKYGEEIKSRNPELYDKLQKQIKIFYKFAYSNIGVRDSNATKLVQIIDDPEYNIFEMLISNSPLKIDTTFTIDIFREIHSEIDDFLFSELGIVLEPFLFGYEQAINLIARFEEEIINPFEAIYFKIEKLDDFDRDKISGKIIRLQLDLKYATLWRRDDLLEAIKPLEKALEQGFEVRREVKKAGEVVFIDKYAGTSLSDEWGDIPETNLHKLNKKLIPPLSYFIIKDEQIIPGDENWDIQAIRSRLKTIIDGYKKRIDKTESSIENWNKSIERAYPQGAGLNVGKWLDEDERKLKRLTT